MSVFVTFNTHEEVVFDFEFASFCLCAFFFVRFSFHYFACLFIVVMYIWLAHKTAQPNSCLWVVCLEPSFVTHKFTDQNGYSVYTICEQKLKINNLYYLKPTAKPTTNIRKKKEKSIWHCNAIHTISVSVIHILWIVFDYSIFENIWNADTVFEEKWNICSVAIWLDCAKSYISCSLKSIVIDWMEQKQIEFFTAQTGRVLFDFSICISSCGFKLCCCRDVGFYVAIFSFYWHRFNLTLAAITLFFEHHKRIVLVSHNFHELLNM